MVKKRKVKIRFKLLILLACAIYAAFVLSGQNTVMGQLD